MPLQLLPLPQVDWSTYYRICWTAFVPGVMEMMYPHGFSDAAMDHATAAQERVGRRHPQRVHFLQVVDTDLPASDPFRGVVGVSQWKIYPRDRSAAEMEKESAESDRDDEEFGNPPGLDATATDAFGDATAECRKKYIGGAAHVQLQAIATRPDHERRGVAALALAWGAQKADELHLPSFLEASAKGVELYKRFGFQIVEAMPFDATKHDYTQPLPHVYMKRPASA